ncbi:MAG: bacteriohopanetetrol glucosamine biosynthesis glycosyltransferase HpnI [Acidobacteriota bacterium]|nr:bacteriohopanetetrol glucosamine biosynthesis glycosyltransferase HpnI [Acidobacteriota bacterium]
MVLRSLLLLLAVAPLVYYLLSLYNIIEYFLSNRRLPPRNDKSAPPASILKPVRGVDSEAYANFASYCQLDYPEYEIIFAASDPEDPVVPIVEKLKRDFPDTQIRLVTSVERLGQNNKISNLHRLVQEAKYDLLVMTDSDVTVQSDYLREVVAPFGDVTVGAVTSFYRCAGGGTLGADLAMLGMCSDSLPSALVARRFEGGVQFAFGWTMATTKQRLAEIGGWESMADYHSDDFELGNRIARQGHRVEIMREGVSVVFPKESLKDFYDQELRWAIGLRNVRPLAYTGVIFTHGLPWAILAAVVAGTAGWTGIAAAYLAAYLILRITVAWTAGVWGLHDENIKNKLWLLPVRDGIMAVIWLAGLLSDRIKWRGSEFRVEKGLLRPVAEETQEN